MTAQEIRNELANRYSYEDARKVCCYNCKYWGFNCGKVLNSRCESRCTKRKKRTGHGQVSIVEVSFQEERSKL